MAEGNEKRSSIAAGIAMRFAAIVVTLAAQAVLLFGAAGTTNWPWVWLYLVISLAVLLVNGCSFSAPRSKTALCVWS